MKILLIEDEPRMAEALRELLRQEGYEVDCFFRGDDGLTAIRSGQYDGVILDVMLPGLSGVEVAARSRKAGIRTPILMLSAKGELDDKVLGLDAGADDYLTKPFQPRELLAVKIWGYENEAEYNKVEVYISFARKKLAFVGSQVEIKAVRGAGYELRWNRA